jgi:diadenosine tetraphosphate (Ap4A) HIT family hydrolase
MNAVNSTIEKFGYPASLLREFGHWVVLLRPAQVTLGSLVLAAKSDATAFGELPQAAFTDLAAAVAAIEEALRRFSRYERINYLMLMMVDPHVHFHVIPRYSDPRQFGGVEVLDHGWPGPPDLKSAIALSPQQNSLLRGQLTTYF